MPAVPRLRDALSVRPATDAPGQHVVVARDGRTLFRLTAQGVFLLEQLDGLSTADDVLLAYEERFDVELTREELAGFLDGLADAGALHDDPRVIEALGYLRGQGVAWRGPIADRRSREEGGPEARGPARRDEASNVALWWDHAVFHLNAGHLERATEVFEQMSSAAPGDLRLREIAAHLRDLVEERAPTERLDRMWEVFDAALADMLRSGACPQCRAPIAVEVGRQNRCRACGSSFSAFVLDRAEAAREDPGAGG